MWCLACTPVPMSRTCRGAWPSSRWIATIDTAAVRRPVTTGPSSWHSGWPVAAAHTVTMPWMVGSFNAALPGCTLTSLWMPMSCEVAGMLSITPPWPMGTTMRSGLRILPSRYSTAAVSIAFVSAAKGSARAVASASHTGRRWLGEAVEVEAVMGGSDLGERRQLEVVPR